MFILFIVFIEGQKCENIFVLREYLQGKIRNEVPFRTDCILNFMMLQWSQVVQNGETPNSPHCNFEIRLENEY